MNCQLSILIPTYCRKEDLLQTLKCINVQTFKNFEVIIIDSSPPETRLSEENIKSFDFIIEYNLFGIVGNVSMQRNKALEKANGNIILFLDDDDALLPDFLAKAKTFCDKFPNEVLYTNFKVIEEDRENPSAQIKTTDISVKDKKIEDVYVKNFIHNHTCLYPAISLKNRQQDSHLASLDDWEFLLNVLSGSEFRHIDINGPVIYKDYVNTGNRRGTSEGAQGSLAIADYLYIYRRWPAPNLRLKQQRKELLKSVGLDVPIEWV
jgi:glycosyltransferase involved in cell wall biosynthesis